MGNSLLAVRVINHKYIVVGKAENIVQGLKETKNYAFICEYLKSEKPKKEFINNLSNIWSEVIHDILYDSKLNIEDKHLCMLQFIYHLNEQKIYENYRYFYFILRDENFLAIENLDTDRILKVFENFNIKLEKVNYEKVNKELFDKIYQRGLYELNFEMISLILREKYGYENKSEICHKNYTLVISKDNEPMRNYIEEDMNTYVNTIIENCEDEITDEEKAVKQLLNNSKLIDVHKLQYIDKLTTQISTSLETIKDKFIWRKLLEKDLVQYSENNMLAYFFKNGMDKRLEAFINKGKNSINYDAISSMQTVKNGKDFFLSIVTSKSLDNEIYFNILKSMNRTLENFSIKNIPDDKMDILMEQKCIKMDREVLLFMRESYSHKVVDFIVINIETYIKIMDKSLFDFQEILEVLKTKISDDYKVDLYGFIETYRSTDFNLEK